MVGTLADRVSGLLDPRFRLTIWLPAVVFSVAVGSVAVVGTGWHSALSEWRSAGPVGEVGLTILGVAAVTLLGFMLAANLMRCLRLLEGYWDGLPGGRRLRERRALYYRTRVRRLADTGADARLYYEFPPVDLEERVMPTRLGNVLRASEVHPSVRYGIDAAIAWPRLYTLLPDQFRAAVAAAKSQMDLMTVCIVLSVAFAIGGGALSALLLPWWSALLCVWTAAISAALSYQALVQSAIPYSELIKSAFDVHRRAMLEANGWTLAPSLADEHAQWQAVMQLWYQVEPTDPAALGYPGTSRLALRPPGVEAPAADVEAPGPGVDAEQVPDTAGSWVEPPGNPLNHLGAWLGVAALLLGVAFAGVALLRGTLPPDQRIVVAVRGLTAYEQLRAAEVQLASVGRGAAPGAITSLPGVARRYTLRAIPAGRPIVEGDLGPSLRPGALKGTFPIQLDARGSRFPATLKAGEAVDVFLRNGPGGRFRDIKLGDIVVLSAGQAPGSLVLAVPAIHRDSVLRSVLRGEVVVVRHRRLR